MIVLVAVTHRPAPGAAVGRVLSRHYRRGAARRAHDLRQRACRRANGPSSFLDLAIIEVLDRPALGDLTRGEVVR